MSKRTILKFNEIKFANGEELRKQTKIIVSKDFIENRVLMPGMRVSLSVKAGSRRRIFSGTVYEIRPTCSCCKGPVFYSIEK